MSRWARCVVRPERLGPYRGWQRLQKPLGKRPGRRPAKLVGTVSHGPPPERVPCPFIAPVSGHSGSYGLILESLAEVCGAARETRALPGVAAAPEAAG